MVFSDDPNAILTKTLSGDINRVACLHCKLEEGWLYPPVFLFVDVAEKRAVAVTSSESATQQVNLLRTALNRDEIVSRRLNPDELLLRTKIIDNYRGIFEATKTPIEQVIREASAILEYLRRETLNGRDRVKQVIDDAINSGILTLERDELTTDFLEELKTYQAELSDHADSRVAQVLEELIPRLMDRLTRKSKTLPRRDESTALGKVLKSTLSSPRREAIEEIFRIHLDEGKRSVLRRRLLWLCSFEIQFGLQSATASSIDFSSELQDLITGPAPGDENETPLLSASHLKVMPRVRDFIGSLDRVNAPAKLEDPPLMLNLPSAWVKPAKRVLNDITNATTAGVIPEWVFDPVAKLPIARALVDFELSRMLHKQYQMSGAMLHLSNALEILRDVDSTSTDPSAIALHAVCLEELARVHLQLGRFEDAIAATRQARGLYESIGATKGVRQILSSEAEIWLQLGRVAEAEELYRAAITMSEGSATADEFSDLMNCANVYRLLRPWATVELEFAPKGSNESPEDEALESDAEPWPALKKKAGILTFIRLLGHDEFFIQDLVGSEQMLLLYRALALATLSGDQSREKLVLGRMVASYSEQGCEDIAVYILDRLLTNSSLEDASLDAQLFVLNKLGKLGESQEDDGALEQAASTRQEQLNLAEFILADTALPSLGRIEIRAEKACLLESLEQPEEAGREYGEVIRKLEQSRLLMRDPNNKRGLQSRRWRPYVRAARNCLRMYTQDRSRTDLLIEAWSHVQAGRSRAMLDAIGDERDDSESFGPKSVSPLTFREVSVRLPKDMVVLEYVLMPSSPGCPGSWSLFAITPNAETPWLVWQEPNMDRVLDAQRKLADVADEFDSAVVETGVLSIEEDLHQRYAAALEEISDVLVPSGFLDELSRRNFRRLVIVADAYLHEVPFTALRPLQGGERVYLGLAMSSSGFQLINAPSSSVFAHWNLQDQEHESRSVKSAALFVDPLGDLSKFNPRVSGTFTKIQTSLQKRNLSVLRVAGSEATPDAWLKEGRGRDLVIYYGHSIAQLETAERGALMLSDGTEGVAPITAEDIYVAATQRLFSRKTLFVLASCSGGIVSAGAWDSDRELRGLSTAHLYAGCSAVISASRPLLDSPTLLLVDAIVESMLAGRDGPSSLSEAQQKLALSESAFAHPHFWGYLGYMGAPGWSLN